ncbi:hypothetical protein QYE76_071697 [Lolium multiflorum]|uniref:F-box domain-containing protein n=1 Tax=Lolium multiflorum TaxID=4521 RepID=A0AAD8SMK8_LOLMU|nr:hypothetical protein QYE76_071580 [Lolium multiflorum]KAK1653892.1 hypothetical protein QYE76_071697 [Lolium multiflorum]
MEESGAGHGSCPQPQPATGVVAPADRISSLPDDLLLHVLSHLGNPGAAARKTLLSRRWRGLFSQLPSVDVTIRDVLLGSLEDRLRHAARPGVRLLDIAVPEHDLPTTDSSEQRFTLAQHVHRGPCGTISSVLREAARMSPVQLRFTVPSNLTMSPGDRYGSVELPRFNRATSIELRTPPPIPLTHSRAITGKVHFPLLESLSLSGCRVDLAALIPRCPRLRELTVVTGTPGDVDFIIQSLLQRLVVDRNSIPTRRIVVQAPELKQLTMSLNASRDLTVSIVAPIVDKVSWRCSYTSVFHGLGFWRLLEVSLETAEGHGWWAGWSSNAGTGEEDAGSQLTRVNILSLRLYCSIGFLGFRDQEIGFAAEISKHMVTDFSGLELHLTTRGHAFGSFVWRLLRMHHISTATRSLRIILQRSEVIVACGPDCPCDGPSDWILQRVSLPKLEKLEIEGFEGEDQEFDFLRLVFRCAPMLTRVTVRLPDQVTPNDDWCTKLHDIFAEYPFVEGNIDLIVPGD